MAIYSKLLLHEGGGIVSYKQQAEQEPNTATILIGLGGTGVDCIRTIKTQVYERLKPDVECASTPSYLHIRFLGVDSDFYSSKNRYYKNFDRHLPLDDTEFFSIANSDVVAAIANEVALKQRPELDWLEYEKIPTPMLGDEGAGGIRQVGRFMMMDKSFEFMYRVQEEIKKAKEGLSSPKVNVHIFAGLSGGTGSGCFLDVCYMIRSIAKPLGGVTMFGYFFMPDVNLSRIPNTAIGAFDYIPKNGYAAMQELDYCMRLEKNGGEFTQVYQGGRKISWNTAPVDMCHLICATDSNGNVIPNAYDYAMNVTAEYIIDFLIASNKSDSLVALHPMLGMADANKSIGAELSYYTIGASCASIPLREINTYLASELFDKFGRINENLPSKEDVERLATNVLTNAQGGTLSSRYDLLYREIRTEAEGSYAVYPNDWKFVRDYGDAEMVKHYTNQTAAQQNKIQANAKSMLDKNNQKSLIGRMKIYLEDILRDIQYGPIFGYKMLAASESHNFLNIIDGLIKENAERKKQEGQQSELRQKDYDNAKFDFDNRRKRSLFDNDEKRFIDYQFYLMTLEQHKLEMDTYVGLDQVLRKFKDQVEEEIASYYIKLAHVMGNLMDTFNENRNALVSSTATSTISTFEIPMMTIEELKDSLDAQIQRMNIPGVLDTFMTHLLRNEGKWIGENENQISRLVIDFFVDTAFNDFANRTITSFLRDKYQYKYGGTVTDDQLTQYVYDDWMKLLTEKATPLFHFNSAIWFDANTSKLAFLSYPEISDPIKQAAAQLQAINSLWGLKSSALTYRISAICIACGFPISAYRECEEYEKKYFATKDVGRHYYEGKKIEGMEFSDWTKLPSIIPQSAMDINKVGFPVDLKKQINESKILYDKALEFGIIGEDSYFYEVSKEDIKKLEQICNSIKKIVKNTDKQSEIPSLQEALEQLKEARKISMVRTKYSLPSDGFRAKEEVIARVQEDYFVSSPAFHQFVTEQVEVISALQLKAEQLLKAIEEKF